MFSSKRGAARLLLAVVISLIIMKGVVSWITNSLSVLAQAADSLLDLLSGVIILVAVLAADKEEDEKHPYGHGKLEDFAGLIQGILIGVAGILIIYSSIQRIVTRSDVQMSEAGIAVMAVSIIASLWLSHHLRRVARQTGSMAIEASASNIAADVYSASAVLVGLALLRISGLNVIDPVIAIAVALYILKIGYTTIRKPFSKLIDTRVSQEEEDIIRKSILKHSEEVVGYHKLRTRQAGDKCHIDLHVVMRKDIPLETSHTICHKIEGEVKNSLPRSSILIHAEPCNDECDQCPVTCAERKP